MTIDDYVLLLWKRAEFFIKGVHDNEILTNKYIKQAIDRHINDLTRSDLEYRTESVERVFKFFYYLNIVQDNEYKQFIPLPFQCFIIMILVDTECLIIIKIHNTFYYRN